MGLSPLNILVTGATIGGIGFETALQLASLGHRLFITCRSRDKAVNAAESISFQAGCAKPEALVLDLSESDSIRNFFPILSELTVSIDVLINNAGFMKTGLFFNSERTEMSMAVNYLGTRKLTECLLPLMDNGSRIINVSSSTASLGKLTESDTEEIKGGFQAYFNSKYALNLYTREIAAELKDRGIMVNALHPGNIATNLWHELWPQNPLLKYLISHIEKSGLFSVVKGAETTIYLAVSEDVRDSTDGFYINCRKVPWPKNCRDKNKNRIILREFHLNHTA